MKREADELESAISNNMNVYEGHLGGYIMSGNSPAPSGLDITHGDPATWFPELWLWAMSSLNVRSVLDVGCAEGHCIDFFHRYGCDVLGVDGSKLAKADSLMPECHHIHDFVDGPYQPPRQYDLVWSCEFVEHVEEQYLQNFLTTFGAARRFVIMTHASPGQPGWHHVNCQSAEYWIDKLERAGFTYHLRLTEHARMVTRAGHFKHTGLVFVAGRGS